MQIFRQYIAPFLIVLVFLLAMVAVSARIFLPTDMMAPAPIEEPSALVPDSTDTASLLPISALLQGLPPDLGLGSA